MKKQTLYILKKYSKMSGDQKMRLGFTLSAMVREVRKCGKKTMGA